MNVCQDVSIVAIWLEEIGADRQEEEQPVILNKVLSDSFEIIVHTLQVI